MTKPPAEPMIRLAEPRDSAALVEIENVCFVHAGERFHLRQIRGLIANPRAVVLVAHDAGGPILGWAAGLLRKSASGRLAGRAYALAVHPDARGRKLGGRLLSQVIAVLRARGAGPAITLEVRSDNDPAIGLYRKLGFIVQADLPHYYGHGVHGLRMVLWCEQR
jgi:ribosomal-protein-alanine N-acetyltransferase